jgi:adenylyltransferase/sulfurtransferase
LLLSEIGVEGQEKLLTAKVLVIGAGGLGSPIIIYLAAAGIGTLGIVEFDIVDLSNLQRQVLYGTSDIGLPKALIAAKRVKEINSEINVIIYNEALNSDNILKICNDFDFIVDATDNLATRFLINDACILLGKTYVFGSIYNFEGQVTVFGAEGGPCYRCLYSTPPKPELIPGSLELGVLGTLPGVVGAIQATEVIKLICKAGNPAIGRLLLYDALSMQLKEVAIIKKTDCPICSSNATIKRISDYSYICNDEPKIELINKISCLEVNNALQRAEEFFLLDVRDRCEYSAISIEGSINLPINEFWDHLDKIEQYKNIKIVIFSNNGYRSMMAAKALCARGYKQIVNLDGGLTEWCKNKLPIKIAIEVENIKHGR